MLALSGPGRRRAGRARAGAYERFKADESAQAITGPYRQLHPDDNNERQRSTSTRRCERPRRRSARRAAGDAVRQSGCHGTRHRAARIVVRVASGGCASTIPSARGARAAAAAAAPDAAPALPTVHRRHRGRRDPLHARQRRVREEVPARDDGRGRRVPRRRRRRLAGHPARELDARGPAGRRARSLPALYRNNRDGTFTDVTRARRASASRSTAWASAAGDYDNDGRTDIYVTGARREPAVPQPRRRRASRTSPTRPASATPASRRAPRGSTTTATAGSTCSSPTTCEWSLEKDLFCTLDGKTKSYCTPESYKGQSPTLYRNRGDGTFEDATKKAGVLRPDRQGARRRAARLRRRRLAGPLRRQRHAAEPASTATSGNGTFADVGVAAGVAFNEAGRGPRRHGRGRRRLRRLRPARAWSSATSRTR